MSLLGETSLAVSFVYTKVPNCTLVGTANTNKILLQLYLFSVNAKINSHKLLIIYLCAVIL